MSLDLLEDLIAIEDLADVDGEAGTLLRWLGENRMLKLERVLVCRECSSPFLRHPNGCRQRFCSPTCRKTAWNRDHARQWREDNHDRILADRRARYARQKAERRAA